MVDQIEDATAKLSLIEIARNRLAKALFFFCLFSIFAVVMINQTGRTKDKDAERLQDEARSLDYANYRLEQFINPSDRYFAEAVQIAFEGICLTPSEAGISKSSLQVEIQLFNKELPFAIKDVDGKYTKCKPEFVGVEHLPESWWLSLEIKRLLIDERKSAKEAVEIILQEAGKLAPVDQEKIRIFMVYWGKTGFIKLIEERWLRWESMRYWVADGKLARWSAPDKVYRDRSYDSRYGWLSSLGPVPTGGRGNEIGSLDQDFRRPDEGRLQDQVGLQIRSSKDPFQALTFIASSQTYLRQEITSYPQGLKTVDLTLGGLSVSLPSWIIWLPAIVVGLLSIFAVFDQKAGDGKIGSLKNIWFPRLGANRDLVGRVPRGIEWIGVFFWATFLALPSFICFWAAIYRFHIPSWDTNQFGRWRDLANNPADWLNAIAFGFSLVLTWSIANLKKKVFSRRELFVAKVVIYFLALTVAFDIGYMAFIGGSMKSLFAPGRLYELIPVGIALSIAVIARKTPSAFGLLLTVLYCILTSITIVFLRFAN